MSKGALHLCGDYDMDRPSEQSQILSLSLCAQDPVFALQIGPVACWFIPPKQCMSTAMQREVADNPYGVRLL